MNCDQIRELFLEFYEHQLSEKEEREFRNHLADCSNCQELFDAYQQTVSDLGELKREPPFWVKFRLNNLYLDYQPVKTKRRSKHLNIFLNKWVVAVAATLIILVNLFYFTNIFPPANRSLRLAVASVESLLGKAESLFEQVKDSGNFIWISIFGKTLFAENRNPENKIEKATQGGQNG